MQYIFLLALSYVKHIHFIIFNVMDFSICHFCTKCSLHTTAKTSSIYIPLLRKIFIYVYLSIITIRNNYENYLCIFLYIKVILWKQLFVLYTLYRKPDFFIKQKKRDTSQTKCVSFPSFLWCSINCTIFLRKYLDKTANSC